MSNREPTIEEWFAIFNVARDKAKRSIEGDYDEYQERYMRIMTDDVEVSAVARLESYDVGVSYRDELTTLTVGVDW